MKRLLFFLLCQIPLENLSARDPWVSLTGLTEAQVNSRAETFSNPQLGLVPEQVSGYLENGAVRFAALWGPRTDGHDRRVMLAHTAAQLIHANSLIQPLGWRMSWINGFTGTDDIPRFNAIYSLSNGVPQVLRVGDSLTAHQAADDDLANAYLENLCAYRDGIQVRYAAVWNQAVFQPSLKVSYGLTAEELNNDVAVHRGQWRLHNLCGYTSAFSSGGASPLRFIAVWRKPGRSTPWAVIPSMAKSNFFATDSNQTGVGWRTAFLQAWNAGDEVVVNAQWVPNGGLRLSYLNSIDTLVREAMEDGEIPALSLAISRRGKLIFKRAYGVADTATNEWAGTDHRFRVASVSKAITGVAVVHALAGQSDWHLDSKVFGSGALFGTDYGSAPYSEFEQAISVRHLLHHTAGWATDGKLWYGTEPSWGSQHKPIIDHQLQNLNVGFEPGTVGRYSNLGFTIAARVVEKITGDSYETYTRNEVFEPCGISSILGPLVGERTRAQKKFMEVSYYPTSGSPDNPEAVDPRRMDGSTAWIARPADLLLLARRVDGDATHEDILSTGRVTALRTRGNPGSSSGYDWETYGLGWGCNNYSDPGYWGHDGSMAGTRAELIVRTDGTSYCWAANAQGGISNVALESILRNVTNNDDWPDLDLFGTYHPAYNAWLAEHFSDVERNVGLNALLLSPEADPDGDKLPNASEYYLGLDPRVPNQSPFSLAIVDGQLRIRWRRKLGIEGASIALQTSSNLESWSGFLQPPIVNRPDLISQVGYGIQEVLIPISKPKRLARFEISIR